MNATTYKYNGVQSQTSYHKEDSYINTSKSTLSLIQHQQSTHELRHSFFLPSVCWNSRRFVLRALSSLPVIVECNIEYTYSFSWIFCRSIILHGVGFSTSMKTVWHL